MIKANELRIGNWVELNGEYRRIDVKLLYNHQPYYSNPIPLTAEILGKCGFDKYGEGLYSFNGERFVIVQMANAYTLFLNKIESSPESMELIKGFHSLHQLQNLYFILTGKELNIRL